MKKYQEQFLNNYQWWHHGFLLKAMEDWFKKASYCHKTRGVLLRSDRTSKQLFVMYQLAKRLREDEIYYQESKVFHSHNIQYGGSVVLDGTIEMKPFLSIEPERANKAKQRDLDLFTGLMRKHLFSWWD